MMRRTFTLITVFLITLTTGPVAGAQDATPVSFAGERMPPGDCHQTPLTANEMAALWYPEGADDAALPLEIELREGMPLETVPAPLGVPADQATKAAVTETIREILACSNAGNPPAAFKLFSVALIRESGPGPTDTLGDIKAWAESLGEPLAEVDQWQFIAITDISVLPDGRVGALVLNFDTGDGDLEPAVDYVIFVQEDGTWKIDAVADFTIFD